MNVVVSGTEVSEGEGVLDGFGVSVAIAVFVGTIVAVKTGVFEAAAAVTVAWIDCGISPQAITVRINIPIKMKR